MGTPYETFVMVETRDEIGSLVGSHKRIVRVIRTYADKANGDEALALLRDAFEPEHVRQFDLLTVPHVE